jgi:hypothetical protein
MAGGIFPGRAFAWNIKCIIFTIIVAAGYWYLPYRNIYVLLFLLWSPYVALAWYDYSYNCEDKMMPTLFPYGRKIYLPFKPPGYKVEFEKMSKEQIAAMDQVDHVTTWTLFIVVLYFIYQYFGQK